MRVPRPLLFLLFQGGFIGFAENDPQVCVKTGNYLDDLGW